MKNLHVPLKGKYSIKEKSRFTRDCLISSVYIFIARERPLCIYRKKKKKNLNFTLHVPIYIQPAFPLLALITVSRQITSGSANPAGVSSSWPFFFLSHGKCSWKREISSSGTMRPGHFHFQTTRDERRAGRDTGGGRGLAGRFEDWHTARGCFLFYARHRWNLA